MRKITSYGILSVMLLVLTAFSGKDSKPFKLTKHLDKQFAFMPMGDAVLETGSVPLDAFFMSKFEVSNAQYREFLNDLKSSGRKDDLAKAQIDTSLWASDFAFNKPYVTYYHSHPAYDNYPVVNVTMEGAELYCKWMENTLNTMSDENGYKVQVRLPSRAEWVRCANGDKKGALYAWGGPYLQNARGQVLCNYMMIGDGSIHFDEETGTYQIKDAVPSAFMGVAGSLNDRADITAPVNAYAQNDFGIHNLNGNVAEMTSDGLACGGSWKSPGYDVRNLSSFEYTEAAPTIGFRPVMTVIQN